jgi:hypothetical protein
MKLSASVRKKNAIEEVLKSGIAFRDMNADNLAVLREIETKHDVSLWIETDYCISAWTRRTAIVKKWITNATRSVYAK